MNQKLGIVGSGMIGAAVARLAIATGLDVVICNSRGPETLAELVAELGPNARAGTLADVVAATDVIVLAIPFAAYKALPADLLAGKTLIDTMNYYPERDGVMPEVKTDTIASSELVQAHLAQSQVVRVLNNLDFVRLLRRARPVGAGDRSAVPLAGDHAQAKAVVTALIERIGYDCVDMGALADSWRSEPTMPIYVNPYWGLADSADNTTFMAAPGQVVTAQAAQTLLDQAVRHDQMFGSLGSFDVKSKRL